MKSSLTEQVAERTSLEKVSFGTLCDFFVIGAVTVLALTAVGVGVYWAWRYFTQPGAFTTFLWYGALTLGFCLLSVAVGWFVHRLLNGIEGVRARR